PVVGRLARLRIGGQDVAIVLRDLRRRDRGELAEVGAGRLVEADLRPPFANPRDGAGEVDDRVRLQRHRSVSGDAVRDQLDAARNLFQRLHRRVLHLAANPGYTAAFGETVLGVDLREVIANQVADADAGAALLARLGHEDDVAIE